MKNLATIGDNEKAINNTVNKFNNIGGIYQFVEINDQQVFVPPDIDGNAIKKNVTDMLANPHRYNITSGANFTVQDIVEKSLSKFLDQKISTICSGRTDSGVHALNQTVHFETSKSRTNESFLKGLNSLMGTQVKAIWIKKVDKDFSALVKVPFLPKYLILTCSSFSLALEFSTSFKAD